MLFFPPPFMAKALTEGAWIYHIARLGASLGMDVVDFPAGCTLDFAVLKLLTVIVHNPFLSINLYWLLTIAMAGAFAALFFRSLQISPLASASFATLFAISPFVFYGNTASGQQFLRRSLVPHIATADRAGRWERDCLIAGAINAPVDCFDIADY